MAREVFLTVSAIPPASEATSEAVSSLRASLGARFPRTENESYLDGLLRGMPRVALARLTAISLLPTLLGSAGIDSRELLLSRDANGRPYVPNAPDLDFNLSHSDSHAVCAVMPGGGRVGVDVEEPIPPDRAAKLMQRYAKDGELARFERATQPWEGFLRLWTLREAIAKQDGRGQPLNFDVSSVPTGLHVCCGHLPDTGAAVALCLPDGISHTAIYSRSDSLPIVWDEL